MAVATGGGDKGGDTVPAIDLHIDTSPKQFIATPVYITSLSTADPAPLALTGAASIYKVAKSGFQVYINDARGASFALAHKWCVQPPAHPPATPCDSRPAPPPTVLRRIQPYFIVSESPAVTKRVTLIII